MRRVIVSITLLIITTGCSKTIQVKYGTETARKGPLSSIRPLNIKFGKFEDKRRERDGIGYVSSSSGGLKGTKFVTEKSVIQIIQDAIAEEFIKNGHIINAANKNIILSGTINSFCLRHTSDLITVKLFGDVCIDLQVTDSKTGRIIYTSRYYGHDNPPFEQKPFQTPPYEITMNKALERMMRQIGIDSKLVEALKNI